MELEFVVLVICFVLTHKQYIRLSFLRIEITDPNAVAFFTRCGTVPPKVLRLRSSLQNAGPRPDTLAK